MWVAPVVGLAAIGMAVYFYFHSPMPKKYHFRMTAGNSMGMRHKLALRLQAEASPRNLNMDLVPSAGSEQALDWVNRREVDMALVQGALTPVGRPHVREVAVLHVEPMHLLVKKELYKGVSTTIAALQGKTVDLEEVGSGTHALATAILEFVGLKPRSQDPVHGYIPASLDRKALFAETDTTRLPDAVFLVSSLPSPTTAYLVTRHGYRLVPLPFAEAFALRSLSEQTGERSEESPLDHIVMGRIQATTIPAFTYGVDPAVPAQPLPTLGTRLLLLAHEDVPAKAMMELVEATYGAEFGQIVRPPLEPKLMDLPPEFPWHAGAVLYQQHNSPLIWGEAMDSAHKGFAIFAAAASGLFVLWQWSKQRGQLGRDKGFHKYISQVVRIEERVMEAEHEQPSTFTELLALRDQLNQLKTKALDEFANGELTGKELLSAFLVQVNDVRNNLVRLTHRDETEAMFSAASKGSR
jgi:TRAP-type uncharacterized transport system substrate-binding protein